MTVVGVHIRKITAEKNIESEASKVGINNNITVKDVKERDFLFGTAKQKGLRFVFAFTCQYTPDVGTIDMEGDVLYLGEEEQAKKLLKEWSDKKQLPGEVMESVLNSALNKCNIEAIKVSQDINLPSPIPLPRIQRKEAQQQQAKAKAK